MTTPKTLGVIYLRVLDTLQGGFEAMSLLKINIKFHWKVAPITTTKEFIDIVEALAKKYGIRYPLKFKGNIHDYISITPNYTTSGEVKIYMK